MLSDWNTERVIALAPDAESAKEGKKLALPEKWQSLGHDQFTIWGQFKGSGSTPYQVKLDTLKLQKAEADALHCTCPSRRKPCKHALALLFLTLQAPLFIPISEPPEFVKLWLDKAAVRARKDHAKKQKQEERIALGELKAPDSIRTAKAFTERRAKIEAGISDLELWLHNLLQVGLADPQIKKYSFWDAKAARLVDAQAPGLARWLQDMGGLSAAGGDWLPKLLGQLGLMYLAIESFKRFDSLSSGTQADLRTVFGWNLKREEADPTNTIRDIWQVIGQRFSDEGKRLRSQRLWLIGSQSQQAALILEFAYGDAPFETRLVPGTHIDAELTFYPGANRLRAFINKVLQEPKPLTAIPGTNITGLLDTYCVALTQNPWLNYFPIVLTDATPTRYGGRWILRDQEGFCLPIHNQFSHKWSLLALSGDYPITVAGEWDGRDFWPTGVMSAGRFVDFNQVGKL